ncbi:MAG: deoxyribodipyrimidine photo-lyase [Pseudomonadota bacterium]
MTVGVVWFRRDLRLTDNPALHAALHECDRVIPVYLHAPDEEAPWSPGAASRWWLHHSLEALRQSLRDAGSDLVIRQGPSLPALRDLIAETGARQVYWNRLYEPAVQARDAGIDAALTRTGIICRHFNASLLREPNEIQTKSGGPYRVFTPFWQTYLRQAQFDSPLAPRRLPSLPATVRSEPLSVLDLLPRIRWDQGLAHAWQPGEGGAWRQLQQFVAEQMQDYPGQRDLPARPGTSRLSAHLHFGEISPRQIWHAVQSETRHPAQAGLLQAGEAWLRQLVWREFGVHLLHHFPHTAQQPLDPRFERFPWRRHYRADLRRWQRGETGIPLVDAGMRELWHTGWMHNRVRMIAASFLTKNLLIPWQEGAQWFWDTLVDADLANNTLGWQWTAGCGADAAPYFRIFNPISQGKRFDPTGDYIKTWLPELSALPAPWVHEPWKAPATVLQEANITLDHYPQPIVDLAATRARALDAWADIRATRSRNAD